MSIKYTALFILTFTTLLIALCEPSYGGVPQKRIALTYDDAPMNDSFLTGAERANRLIAGLKQAGVSQAAFFITTQGINSPQRLQRVQSYAAAGHVIANHSHTHPWLRDVSVEDYLADIDRAEETLALIENMRPWFRYPFLNEAPSLEKRDRVRAGLTARGLHNGYVTVDVFDWYLNDLYQQATTAGDSVCMPALATLYVNMIVNAAEFYDELAQQTLERSPAHTLLLHENDLAAFFVTDLVAGLQKKGWQIITADQAYRDPIALAEPDTLLLGQGRIAALAIAKGRDPQTLQQFAIDQDQIKEAFESEYKVREACK